MAVTQQSSSRTARSTAAAPGLRPFRKAIKGPVSMQRRVRSMHSTPVPTLLWPGQSPRRRLMRRAGSGKPPGRDAQRLAFNNGFDGVSFPQPEQGQQLSRQEDGIIADAFRYNSHCAPPLVQVDIYCNRDLVSAQTHSEISRFSPSPPRLYTIRAPPSSADRQVGAGGSGDAAAGAGQRVAAEALKRKGSETTPCMTQ